MTSEYHHGLSFVHVNEEARPVDPAKMTTVGIIGTAGAGVDNAAFPPEEARLVYTHETEKLQKLGIGGTLRDAINAVAKGGKSAAMIIGRIEEVADIDEQLAKALGSAASQTGVHMFDACASELGLEPNIIIAPGFTSQRPGNAANPVVSELLPICRRLMAVTVADGPDTTREAALQYRQDFDSSRLIIVDPHVKVWREGDTMPTVQPASGFVAGLGVRRDKEKGGPFWSWSNQTLDIAGVARPISYYIDDPDSEANFLNAHQIATIYRETGGQITGANGGFTFWGNESASSDPLWRFYSVQRGRDFLLKSIKQSLKPFLDNNNITAHAVVSVYETLNGFLRGHIARGHIIDGEITFDPRLNPSDQLRLGNLRIEFRGEEAPPMQHITIASQRYEAAFETLIGDVLREIEATSLAA